MEAGEHGAEVGRADGDHGRKADGGVHRVAASHPIPEAEHVVGVDAEVSDFLRIGGDGHKMAGDGLGVFAQSLQQPVARALGIGHGLQRRKGFRGDDEERFSRVQVAGGFDEINAVHIGNEPEDHVALAVVPKRFVGHNRTEV